MQGDSSADGGGAWERIDRFMATERPATPCVVVDRAIVARQYHRLAALLPAVRIFYAVKANPHPDVIATLAACGAQFDLASPGEIERCRGLGIAAGRMSYGNTIKRERDIAAAHADGIDLFAFDTAAELEKLARAAPGARVFCRLLLRNAGAEWPLSRKFGCDRATAAALLVQARALGLRPVGVSFHVGSQQTDPGTWAPAIGAAAEVFAVCARHGVTLDLLNLGGGLPAQYRSPLAAAETYAEAIETGLAQHFGASRPDILIEPGRYLVGDAGLLRAEVILIAERPHRGGPRWVYIDAGRYNGLPETQGESIHYRLRTPRDGGPTGPVILSGPTCDSTDIIYQHARYDLPLDLAIGDTVDFLSAGAYTASYAAVEFNGFPPLRTWCI